MPRFQDRTPQVSVRLYKTIQRKRIDGRTPVSERYQAQSPYIDLTPFLGEGSSVVTHKSVKEPAGAFSITFPDLANQQQVFEGVPTPFTDLESLYGLIEPMDIIEIRMWGGHGPVPSTLPIKMRGFVSRIGRGMVMSRDGTPIRTVEISGQDYGKLWQMYQIVYMAAYLQGKLLLTNFRLWELFEVDADNTLKAGDFVRQMIEKIINPYLADFMPPNSPMPSKLTVDDDDIRVAHGVINRSYQNAQGSIYNALYSHGDVGVWNELYTEDREDGVHVVYRPIPALTITPNPTTGSRKIQADAPDPIYVDIPDSAINSIETARTDADVANFYWVDNSRFDMIDGMARRMMALGSGDPTIDLSHYPNSRGSLYGVRLMDTASQQGGDGVSNMLGTPDRDELRARMYSNAMWLDLRRWQMVEMNKDNVVYERGGARIQGGLLRPDGTPFRAGDYARFKIGTTVADAYVTSLTDQFIPYQGYTAVIDFERGEGFINRAASPSIHSPWLAEQALREDDS